MLNTAVPYEVPTLHANRYNYPRSAEQSPSRHTSVSTDSTSTRRQSIEVSDENEHYVTLAQKIQDAPPVIVFFSFLNEQSRRWALEYQVAHNIRKNVPQGTTVARYHTAIRNDWQFGQEMTHVWAVAESLHIDDKIIGPLFSAIHSRRVHDLEGVRQIFDECGIPPDMFLKEWAKPAVLANKDKMESTVAHLDLNGTDLVPCILVGGRYGVKLDTYTDFDMKKVIGLVQNLLNHT